MKALIVSVVMLVISLAGCASIGTAGVASYTVKPMVIDGKTYCCEASIQNGKEIAELDVLMEKSGDAYRVSLRERGVTAFKGQALAVEAATAGAVLGGAAIRAVAP